MIQFSASTIFCCAVIMIGTFTASAIIFPEDDTNYINNYPQFHGVKGTHISFSVWLDLNYFGVYQKQIQDFEITDRISYSAILDHYISLCYRESKWGGGWMVREIVDPDLGIFSVYDPFTEGCGMQWFNSKWVQETLFFSYETLMGTTKVERIEDDYHKYLQNIGVEEIPELPEGDIWGNFILLLSNMWDGFNQFMRLITFTSIPHMPVWVLTLLNVFFIPMWIVLVIGFSDFVMNMIKTLASLKFW